MSCAIDPVLLAPSRKADALRYLRPLVEHVLRNWINYRWSLQGFGMLRTYLSKELRLHVWDSRFAVKDVSTIHDHPWNFESRIIAGRLVNTRYRVEPCTHSDAQLAPFVRPPFIKERIVCGPGGGTEKGLDMTVNGARVWLIPFDPETYEAGDTYRQQADEVHHTWCENGTVTIVHRDFLKDTEHANVFYKADSKWVSAEPHDATPDEISAIIDHALTKF